MEDDVVLEVANVSKKYSKSLRNSMFYGMVDIGKNAFGMCSHSERLRKGEFWAVKDVSFQLRKGETLGLIGPNGSGKTTLLKIINGIFWPDKGRVTVRGRTGALISVGAGFHPLLTGRENIFINAAILGMTRNETRSKFDSIVDFADIMDFVDSPVKHYSSGMFVRLGFAVAIHCDPDILLVDEVLAVGDVSFQKKCYMKIKELVNQGTAVILVSHSSPTILTFCRSALLLYKGEKYGYGDALSVMRDYNGLTDRMKVDTMRKEMARGKGTSKIYFKEITFSDPAGKKFENNEIPFCSPFVVSISYTSDTRVPNPLLWAAISRENDLVTILGGLFCDKYSLPSNDLPAAGRIRITVKEQNFAPGVYLLTLGMRSDVDVSEELLNNNTPFRVMDDQTIRGIPYDNRSVVIMKNDFELFV